MKYAYIENNVAVEVVAVDPFMLFVPHYAEKFTSVNDSCNAGYIFENGQWIVPIEKLKASHWDNIKAERDKRLLSGGFQVSGNWFHSDTFSRTQQIGLVMMGANIPADLQWKTMSGTFIPMTQTLANQIFTAAAESDKALFARAEEIKAIMEADPENFKLSDQTWPPVYGE